MRAIKQILNAKLKNSKFFDYFIKNYGESATKTVTDDEIYKNLKSFYLDIAFGNLQQEKYLDYIRADPRIIMIAMNDSQQKLIENYIILESLKFARGMGAQCTQYEQYNKVLADADTRYFTYAIINKALTDFHYSNGNMDYLISVSVQFNNPMHRGSRAILL